MQFTPITTYTSEERRILFGLMLQLYGYRGQKQWAAAHKISRGHLSHVLNGMHSQRTEDEIDRELCSLWPPGSQIHKILRDRLEAEKAEREARPAQQTAI